MQATSSGVDSAKKLWIRIANFFRPEHVVWTIWILLTINAIRFVVSIAHPVPLWDDWAIVPYATGAQPVTWEWLWDAHNEHRMLIGKALLVWLIPLFNGDFRVEVFAILSILIGLSALLIFASKRLRGRASYADAVFPLALLHCGHIDLYLGILILGHAVSVLAACVLIWMMAASHETPNRRQLAVAGLCMLTMPFCGAGGLPLVLAGSCWLGLTGWQKSRTAGWLRHGLPDWGISLAGVALVGVYFIGLDAGTPHPRTETFSLFLNLTGQALTMTVLPMQWMQKYWPWIGFVVPVSVAAATIHLTRQTWKFDSTNWITAAGALLFLLASLVPAVAIGWSRGWLGPLSGTATRYGFFLFPTIVAVYFAFLRFETSWATRVIPLLLCCAALWGLKYNQKKSFESANVFLQTRQSFEADVDSGATVAELARKYSGSGYDKLFPREDLLAEKIMAMKQSGFVVFDHIADDSPARISSEETPAVR